MFWSENRLKVLRVVAGVDPDFGGPSVSSLESAVAAARAGVETTVAFPTIGRDGGAVARLTREGVDVVTFPLTRIARDRCRRWGVSVSLVRWLVREARRFDVLHAHGAWTLTTAATLLAGRLRKRPTVLSPHETLTAYDLATSGRVGRIAKRALRHLVTRFDLLVFASRLERRDSGLAGSVICHPVAVPDRHVRTPSTGSLRIGFLGRPDPKKNLALLIRTLPVGATLTIAGVEPPDSPRTGDDGRVRWLGWLGDAEKRALFESIDLLAMPSEYECFGMAAAEALAARVPVLVSSSSGIAELVEAYGCGFVVAPREEELRAALAAIVADPGQLEACAARIDAVLEGELSHAAHGAALRREYAALLARAGVRRRAEDVPA